MASERARGDAGAAVQRYLAHEKRPPPLGPPKGPRMRPTVGSYGGWFLMSEVPLYRVQHADPGSVEGFEDAGTGVPCS